MKCPLGHDNPDENRFCGECGSVVNSMQVTSAELPAFLIRSPRDAEIAAGAAMRHWGYQDARLTPVGPDGGVDVESGSAVAQVKAQLQPTGIAEVQQLLGAATAARKDALFFSLGGYTQSALRWATNASVALFEFDLSGHPTPMNNAAYRVATDQPTVSMSAVELAWATRVSTQPQEQMMIAGGVAVVACRGVAVALDVRSGQILWEEPLYSSSEEPGPLIAAGGVVASAEVTGTNYFSKATTRLRRLALDSGQTLWETQLSGIAALGTVGDDWIGGTGSGDEGEHRFLWAVDADSGQARFRVSLQSADRISYAAALDGRLVCSAVTGTGESVIAVDSSTGQPLWTLLLSPQVPFGYGRYFDQCRRHLAVEENTVLIAADIGNDGVGRVWRLSADGKELWHSSRVIRYPHDPAMAHGQVSVVGSGVLVSIDPCTGRERWRIGTGSSPEEEYHWAVPCEEGILYAKSQWSPGNYDTWIACADRDTGDEIWRWGQDIPFVFGPAPACAPGGLLVFSTTGAVCALDARSAVSGGEQAALTVADASGEALQVEIHGRIAEETESAATGTYLSTSLVDDDLLDDYVLDSDPLGEDYLEY